MNLEYVLQSLNLMEAGHACLPHNQETKTPFWGDLVNYEIIHLNGNVFSYFAWNIIIDDKAIANY